MRKLQFALPRLSFNHFNSVVPISNTTKQWSHYCVTKELNEWHTYINGAKNSTFTVITDDDDGDSAGDVGDDDNDDDDDDDDHNDNDDDNHHNLTLDQKSFFFLGITNI